MKKSNRVIAVMLALVMVFALAACSGTADQDPNTADTTPAANTGSSAENTQEGEAAQPDTKTVTDLAGREVTMPANVTKIAALTGPVFETIIMLGGADQVVITGNSSGASGWGAVVCPEYADIPVAEDATNPNVEKLIELGVEVAFFWDSYPEVTEALEAAGIAVVVTQLGNFDVTSVEEFLEFKKQEINVVAGVLGGDALDEAADWCAYADETVAKLTAVTDTLSPDEIPSVYYVRGPEALKIHGGASNTRYLVEMAGGDLVSKNDDELLYTTTMEQAIEWDAEYIIMGRVDNIELITEDAAWAPVQAVKNGNVYVNLKGVGPTDYCTDCFLLAEQIATILHPDLFSDIDMVQECKDYFSDFYEYDLTDDQAQRVLSFQAPEG